MSAPGRRDCRFHAGGAAAHHQNLFLSQGRGHIIFFLQLGSNHRIHRTAVCTIDYTLPQTNKAAQAGGDVLLLARVGLFREEGIRQQRPSQLHDIGLTGGDDLLTLLRVAQGTHAGYRLGHHLFDGRRQIYVAAVIQERRWMGSYKEFLPLMAATGDIEQIHPALHHPGQLLVP